MSLFETGVRPLIDKYLREQSEKERDYGDYWSASSAGYCMRLNIMRRLKIPKVPELADDQDRQTRVFEAGHIFHEWAQRITKNAGISLAQEDTLQDDKLMIRGHFDDIIRIEFMQDGREQTHRILYDYKTANSRSFDYKKDEIGYYHKMQLGTYLYMINMSEEYRYPVTEGRILTIEKDTLRMREQQLIYTDEIKQEVLTYWNTLNKYWEDKLMPPCTCADKDGGFMGKRTKAGKVYNDFFYEDEPCSLKWYAKNKVKETK